MLIADIFSNLHSKYSKAHVIKALDKLVEEGELLSKLYGKTSIYSIKQNIVENNKSEHILDAIDIEINKTTDKMNIIKAENKKLEEGSLFISYNGMQPFIICRAIQTKE